MLMRYSTTNGLLAALALASLSFTSVRAADAPSAFKDDREKVNYAMGMNIANSWKRNDIEVDLEVVLRGIKDTMAGKTLLTEVEVREVMKNFQSEMRNKALEKRRLAGEKNKQDSEKFLAENKTKAGVVSLPSGLQYKVIADGSGALVTTNDSVTVHYRGTLIDGTEFDSSFKRNQPAKFNATGVIKGWTEALLMMKPGAKWQVYIPSWLAYGDTGSGQMIGPNAALIFDIELLSAEPAPKLSTAPVSQPVTSDIIRVPSKEELDKGAKVEIIKAEDAAKLQKQAADQKAAETKK